MTLNDYRKVCTAAARIVTKFGDAYLPIFERALKELKKVEAEGDLKSLAQAMASEG